ncbi:MAG: hypothetical protein LBE31_10430 [Deltaproteobacteria bacterium]|jgi:hypothetical protein|nr:hypothetical protein [Deltaproteobacteria bacterium]
MARLFKKKHIFLLIITLLFISIAGIFLFAPSLVIKSALNRDLPSEVFSSISTDNIYLSFSLDSLKVSALTLTPRQNPERPITVDEITINNINRIELIKLLLGRSTDNFGFLRDGLLTIRRLNSSGPLGPLSRIKIGSFSLREISAERADDLIASSNMLNNLKIASLSLTDVEIVDLREQYITLDSLAIFNLSDAVIGSLTASGLNAQGRNDFKTDLDNVAIAGLNVENIIRAITSQKPLNQALLILNSFAGIDLASLSFQSQGLPPLTLKKALIDTIGSDAATSQRLWKFEDLQIDLSRPENFAAPIESFAPAVQALLVSLGEKPNINLEIKSQPSGLSIARLNITDRADLSLNLLVKNSKANSGSSPTGLLLNSMTTNIGPGKLEIVSYGMAKDFLTQLNQRLGFKESYKQSLAKAFDSWLEGLIDPDEGDPVLNRPILNLEMQAFLDNPSKIAVNWEPEGEGFPKVFLNRIGGLSQLISDLSNQAVWPTLADKYKYDIIQSLNLSMEANNRAKVAVYAP